MMTLTMYGLANLAQLGLDINVLIQEYGVAVGVSVFVIVVVLSVILLFARSENQKVNALSQIATSGHEALQNQLNNITRDLGMAQGKIEILQDRVTHLEGEVRKRDARVRTLTKQRDHYKQQRNQLMGIVKRMRVLSPKVASQAIREAQQNRPPFTKD